MGNFLEQVCRIVKCKDLSHVPLPQQHIYPVWLGQRGRITAWGLFTCKALPWWGLCRKFHISVHWQVHERHRGNDSPPGVYICHWGRWKSRTLLTEGITNCRTAGGQLPAAAQEHSCRGKVCEGLDLPAGHLGKLNIHPRHYILFSFKCCGVEWMFFVF